MNVISVEKLYKKKFRCFKAFPLPWTEILGDSEDSGVWLIYGKEKNGKTTLALSLAKMLSRQKKVLYVSAEEGLRKSFIETCQRVQISIGEKFGFLEYVPLTELCEKLKKQRSADIIFIDNITVYVKELEKGQLRKMVSAFPDKLFVFIAHEDRGEPSKAPARDAEKFADAIMHVKGLACVVGGRVPGGKLSINEDKAKVYFGDEVKED